MTSQNCSFCPLLQRCQGEPASADWRAINSLVCRLKLGIEVDTATRALLDLLRPKILNTAQFIERGIAPIKLERDTIIRDLESAIIMDLIKRYRLGDRAYPLTYLFGPRGSIYGFALKYIEENNAYYEKHTYHQPLKFEDFEDYLTQLNAIESMPTLPLQYGNAGNEVEPETNSFDDIITDVMNFVHDGHTLTLPQYRIMSFCLRNANTNAVNPTRNLHAYLAGIFGVARILVSRHYMTAARKLIERVGQGAKFLARRGITVGATAAERRNKWAKGQSFSQGLSPEDDIQLAKLVENGASIVDACFAMGVSDSYYRKVRKRLGKQSTSNSKNHGVDGLPTKKRIRR